MNKTWSYKWASIILITMISTFFFVQITNAAVPEGHDFTSIPAGADYAPGELLVRFAPKAKGIQRSAEEKYQILSSLGGGTVERNYTIVPGLSLVKLPTGLTVKDALKTFNKTDGILYAEPNYRVKAFSAVFPNDPYGPKPAPDGGEQWHLHNIGQDPPEGSDDADIDAPEGWDIHTGSSEIIVAVIDTGVDYEHEDLAANMWTNPGEQPGDGNGDGRPGVKDIDDDGDGLVDEDSEGRDCSHPDWTNDIPEDDDENGYENDFHGYDFCNYDADPIDDEGHGTACAGLVGAVGNNGVGVTGVCWNVKIMAMKFLDEYGSGYTSDAISCVEYANLMGARVMSNSWGGGGYNSSLEAAIKAAKANGVVFIAASGNSGGSVLYPAKHAEAIAVGATDEDDDIWDYSCHGPELDVVAASGDTALQGNIWTTDITGENNGYDNRDPLIFDYTDLMGGTSAAAPQVAGLAALILSVNPDLTSDEVQFIIESTADDKGDPGWDQYYGWGRINNESALLEAVEFPTDDELVGWWKFDETTGTTAEDSAGDNNGTLNNFPPDPWVTGKINGALDFDGTDDYVVLDHSVVALKIGPVTISAWIKADDLNALYHPVVSTYYTDGSNHYGYLLYIGEEEEEYKPAFYIGNDQGKAAISGIQVNTIDWYHVAGTYDGSDLKIYVNGGPPTTIQLDGLTGYYEPYDDTYIGYEDYIPGDPPVGAVYFDGKIDDVRVYNYALSIFEIWDAMSVDSPSRFRIKDSSGETVAGFDDSGNLFLKGTFEQWSSYTAKPDRDEFRVQGPGGYDVAIIDATDGNMYITGTKYENHNMVLYGQHRFIVKDSNGYRVAYINGLGNLYLKGNVYQNAIP